MEKKSCVLEKLQYQLQHFKIISKFRKRLVTFEDEITEYDSIVVALFIHFTCVVSIQQGLCIMAFIVYVAVCLLLKRMWLLFSPCVCGRNVVLEMRTYLARTVPAWWLFVDKFCQHINKLQESPESFNKA